MNIKSTRNSRTLNYPVGLNQPKSQILFYKNISPRDFYEIILLPTICCEIALLKIFTSDFKNSLTPLCKSPVDATSGYIFAKAIPILSYHKSRTIFSLVAIHILRASHISVNTQCGQQCIFYF